MFFSLKKNLCLEQNEFTTQVIFDIWRSDQWRCFIEKVYRNFAKLAGKHLCWSLFKKKLYHRCFSCGFCKILKTPISKNIWKMLLLNVCLTKLGDVTRSSTQFYKRLCAEKRNKIWMWYHTNMTVKNVNVAIFDLYMQNIISRFAFSYLILQFHNFRFFFVFCLIS